MHPSAIFFSWKCLCMYVLQGEAMLWIQAGCQENMTIAQALATQLLANLTVCYYSKHEICGKRVVLVSEYVLVRHPILRC